MEIRILRYDRGEGKDAAGCTVVIDVFRAFSTACYLAGNNADLIIPLADLDQAYAMKHAHPEYLLIGERGGEIQDGFDFGNSPSALKNRDMTQKTVLLSTSAGTKGLLEAKDLAQTVLTGSFVNAGATVERIREISPETVSLLCMGWNGEEPADEDILCARYLEHALKGSPVSFAEIVSFLTYESTTKNFLNQLGRTPSRLEDFSLCLQLDKFSFALQAAGTELLYLEKV